MTKFSLKIKDSLKKYYKTKGKHKYGFYFILINSCIITQTHYLSKENTQWKQ